MKKNILLRTATGLAFTAICFLSSFTGFTQKTVAHGSSAKPLPRGQRIFYGDASFYANKFHGRKTANGEIFNQDKFTAACNVLPLGTWIKVTNLKNGKSVIVRTTDRLHRRMPRLVDLSKSAAKKLGYIKSGLTRVKVEVLNQKLYK